jgi:chorismate mutase
MARQNKARAFVLAAAAMPTLILGAAQAARADNVNPLFALVDAAAQRLQTADPVAAAKYLNGGPIDDSRREQQVIDGVTAAAAAKHIDTEYIRTVFHNQMDATSAVEHARFADWKLNPGAAPTAAADLSAIRATIDRFTNIMVNEVGAQWDQLNSPDCVTELASAKAAVVAARQLDDFYERALTYATHAYCRPM